MAISPLPAAKHLCQKSGWTLCNLDLQKMIYMAQMFHLGKHDQPLVKGRFVACDYGPIHPVVYKRLRMFGSKPIKNIFRGIEPVEEQACSITLDVAYDALSDRRPSSLVAMTHDDNGAWARNYRAGRCAVIPNAHILAEYRMKRQRSAEAGAADDAPSNDAPEKPDTSVDAVNAAARARAGMPEDWVPYVWEWISGGLLLTGCRTRPEASGSGYRFLMDEDNKRVILSDAEINALRSA